MARPSFRPSPTSTLPTATSSSSSGPDRGASSTWLPTSSPRAPPLPSLKSKRTPKAGPSRARRASETTDHSLVARQGASSGPVFEGYPSCDNVGNTLLSCFPLSNTTITQSTWSKFIYNSNYPSFVENGEVDVWLYQADSGEEVRNWKGIPTRQGSVEIRPDEDWWKDQDRATELTQGGRETYSFYFVVVPGGETLNGAEPHQNTFRAIQTALPSAVLASISLSSASASMASVSSASLAAASSSSSAGTTSTEGGNRGGRGADGTLQNAQSGGSGFPKWAIAVIVILGVFLIISLLALWWFLLAASRRNRRRDSRIQENKAWKGEEGGHAPDASISTAGGARSDQKHADIAESQIMDEKAPISPHDEPESSAIPVAAFAARRDQHQDSSSIATARPVSRNSRASLIPTLKPSTLALNRQRSGTSGIGSHVSVPGPAGSHAMGADNSSIASSGPISPGEAEDLAVAFRQAMRKAGDQPLTEDSSPETESPPARTTASTLMRQELQGEGVGIKPVGDRRSYHLQGLDDDSD